MSPKVFEHTWHGQDRICGNFNPQSELWSASPAGVPILKPAGWRADPET
jgi:hypothetical protein